MRDAAVSSATLDWLMLSYAREAVRFGALHSTFIKTAAMAGCGVKLGQPAERWRYKAAASWLLKKVDDAGRGVRRKQLINRELGRDANGRGVVADGGAGLQAPAADECASPVARMLNTTPCATPCLEACRRMIYAAYA